MSKKAVFAGIAKGLAQFATFFVEHPELVQIVASLATKGK